MTNKELLGIAKPFYDSFGEIETLNMSGHGARGGVWLGGGTQRGRPFTACDIRTELTPSEIKDFRSLFKPQGVLQRWKEARIILWGCKQGLHRRRKALAKMLGVNVAGYTKAVNVSESTVLPASGGEWRFK